MEQLKAYKLVYIFIFLYQGIFGQVSLSGKVIDAQTKESIPFVEVYNKTTAKTIYGTEDGAFSLTVEKNVPQKLVFIGLGYELKEETFTIKGNKIIVFELQHLAEELNEVIINQRSNKIFGIKNLKDVEGTAIYAGKKTEVVLIEQQVANKATGNPRQAFAQVAGLNIYETENAGLQLNIGGRGLDPNRSANFNTRQNGYDISADVLGYPESYYSPSFETIEEIQIVRGAASLQYGTQFGGLINFKLKKPNPTKGFEWISRLGSGSFGILNIFNSVSGTKGKTSYYAYHQYKEGDGFRDNSSFDSNNFYALISHQFNENTKLTLETTYLKYLAQQAGGLDDDAFFNEDPFLSIRTRNFFGVEWLLSNIKLEHDFNSTTKGSLNIFSLNAERNALGFRNRRPSTEDDLSRPRELIVDEFNNWGAEAKLLKEYTILGKEVIGLIGAKYYQSDNESRQGVGSNGTDSNFRFRNDEFFETVEFPQSDFDFPNLNLSLFGENIFRVSDNFSVTPGFRLEYIKTEALGDLVDTSFSGNGAMLNEVEVTPVDRVNERSFLLFGLGLSYKPTNSLEVFANFSQNFRSVTFNDIQIDNPSLLVDPNIQDETGYTFDIGFRGTISNIFRYDANVFALLYDNRIGEQLISINNTNREDFRGFGPNIDRRSGPVILRGNTGKAQIFGLESLTTVNLSNWLFPKNKNFHWQHFFNLAIINSEYIEGFFSNSEISGNEVEYVPDINLKAGVELGYKNFKSSLQLTHVGNQFSESTNVSLADATGVIGEIPAYTVFDFSLEYTHKKWKLETGVNNVFDETYFTQRATGYPGPGIIPSSPRNLYAVLQFTF